MEATTPQVSIYSFDKYPTQKTTDNSTTTLSKHRIQMGTPSAANKMQFYNISDGPLRIVSCLNPLTNKHKLTLGLLFATSAAASGASRVMTFSNYHLSNAVRDFFPEGFSSTSTIAEIMQGAKAFIKVEIPACDVLKQVTMHELMNKLGLVAQDKDITACNLLDAHFVKEQIVGDCQTSYHSLGFQFSKRLSECVEGISGYMHQPFSIEYYQAPSTLSHSNATNVGNRVSNFCCLLEDKIAEYTQSFLQRNEEALQAPSDYDSDFAGFTLSLLIMAFTFAALSYLFTAYESQSPQTRGKGRRHIPGRH